MLIARVPVYGTGDAGRKFWTKARKDILNKTFEKHGIDGVTEYRIKENQLLKCFYHMWTEDEEGKRKTVLILLTQVDDYNWANFPEYDHIVPEILANYEIRKIEEGTFRFNGKEYTQLPDKSIRVTCEDNASAPFGRSGSAL